MDDQPKDPKTIIAEELADISRQISRLHARRVWLLNAILHGQLMEIRDNPNGAAIVAIRPCYQWFDMN